MRYLALDGHVQGVYGQFRRNTTSLKKQPITLLEKASTLEANIASPRSWDVLFIAHPEFIRRLWLEVSLDEVRIERTFRIFSGASSTLAAVHAFYPCLSRTSWKPFSSSSGY